MPTKDADRIQYRCRACTEEFTNAGTSNAHHKATGHHQTFRCWSCPRALSSHSHAEYETCAQCHRNGITLQEFQESKRAAVEAATPLT
jgi:uncharacterized CHY-type Zn-finger protein